MRVLIAMHLNHTLTIINRNKTMTNFRRDMMVLQAWFSPAFPTGAFSYSHGLETAIHEGLVTDVKLTKLDINLALTWVRPK